LDRIKSFNDWKEQLDFDQVSEAMSIDWNKTGLPKNQEVAVNSTEIKPYDIAFEILEDWLEGVKTLCESNIKNLYKKIFGEAFKRVVRRIAPVLAKYIIPRVEAGGKEIIKGEPITGPEFWKLAWPKVWAELGWPEKSALKKFTILDENTDYDTLMNSLAATLSDPGYAAYLDIAKGEVSKLNDSFANKFSDETGTQSVAENPFIESLMSDLNSRLANPSTQTEPTKDEVESRPDNETQVGSTKQGQTAKGPNSAEPKDQSTSGGKISTPSANDPQSVRKWFSNLNPADQIIVRDVIKTIR